MRSGDRGLEPRRKEEVVTSSPETPVLRGHYPSSHFHHNPRFVGQRRKIEWIARGSGWGEPQIVFVGTDGAHQPKVKDS